MTTEEKKILLENICVYDKRSPYYDEENGRQSTSCYCDNCFNGRTVLAEWILDLLKGNQNERV